MRNKAAGAALLLGLSLASAGGAQAQGSGALSVRLKLGTLQISDTTTKNVIGSNHGGIEADLGSKLAGGSQFLTVGYFERKQGGNFLRTIPVTVTSLGAGPLPLAGLYTTSGFGVYLLSTRGRSMRSQFGGFIGVGLRLGGGLFAEAKWHQVQGDVNGLSPNGAALLIGKQF